MMLNLLIVLVGATQVAAPTVPGDTWGIAAQNGVQQQRSLVFCWRFVQGWLQHTDPATGLIPRNLSKDAYWNARDSAADNYPFMVLSTWFTDRSLFDGPMHAMLSTEQRLCNRVDRLPDDWLFETQVFRTPAPDMDTIIFGASEYVKDGLVPMTEWMGPSPWSERMLGLIDDLWKHRIVESEVGPLPTISHEVAGEMMQTLSRLTWMTGNPEYKADAYLLASYFLDYHLPTEADKLRLDDHGCEVLGGLSEVYFLAQHQDPERYAAWKPRMHTILDRVLEVGRDEKGLLFNTVNPVTGEVLSEDRTDNWGYNYNAFSVVGTLDGHAPYLEAIDHVLRNLPGAKDYPWENDGADGIADSLEGGINLINRYPLAEAMEWAEYTAERLLAKQRPSGIVEGWHGDGNSARTLLMYALWKSRGTYVREWRADLSLGAAVEDGSPHFLIQAEWPWRGKLHFDIPRHSEYLHLPEDYPRLNQFPEWFTVEEDASYEVRIEGKNPSKTTLSGTALREGILLEVDKDTPARVTVIKVNR